ncbi:hypothetical protein [Paenibacillus paridis]|uniref:hypothetical protein n=1 Tax=Paenibacillus paridis TaxID=2583376 RepID=UPI0011218237|nr:hypothetical protein [Paenibacillus paridis]
MDNIMNLELNKQFARKIGIMIESGLIWHKHYFLFCDELIEKLDKPPYWIIELAIAKYIGDAIEVVNTYAFSEPFENFSNSLCDLYIGCLYIRYERRQLSWASFLTKSDDFADGSGYFALKKDADYFYSMLNDYEDNEYSIDLENKQAERVKQEFQNEISEVRNMYIPFIGYFREFVSTQSNKQK